MGKKAPKQPPAVVVPPPVVIPLVDDAQVRAAKKKSIAKQTQTSGRASTMLTANQTIAGDPLGAG